VAAGIFGSRILGLVRQRVFGHYFGTSPLADAFTAAFRIPNLLQNLFGEGGLSASFIPVYASLLARGEADAARRLAGGVAALLGLVVATIVAIGVAAAPWLVDLIVGGFSGSTRALTITLVRILFPGAGLLVLSAWCLGMLNSHRRFFLAYAAPMAWNLAIIASLVFFGRRLAPERLVLAVAWGSVVGSLLQLLVQLPGVRAAAGAVPLRLQPADPNVRAVVRGFGPALVTRGIVQISAFVDITIASFLPAGAVAAFGAALVVNNLPVSLFGMAVTAAELPEMSADGAESEEGKAALRTRLDRACRRIALGVVPSSAAFAFLGVFVSGALFESGRFTRADSEYVWSILAGSAVGLLAATLGRLYSSAHFALRDTVTPFRIALLRVMLSISLGAFAALLLPRLLGVSARWGAAGLTASSGLVAWFEFYLLKQSIDRRIGRTCAAGAIVAQLWGAALLGVSAAWGVATILPPLGPLPTSALVLGTFVAVYCAAAVGLRVPEAGDLVAAVQRRLRG